MALNVDGHLVPSRPYQPSFDDKGGIYTRDYFSIFSNCGMAMCDHGNGITYEDYAKGYAIWVFDVTPDSSAFSSHSSPTQTGTVRLEMKFAQALDKAIDVLAYAEFEQTIEIDESRNVSVVAPSVR
jgi:hypothetical protein